MIIDFYINFLIMYKRGLGMPLPCDNHQDIIYFLFKKNHLPLLSKQIIPHHLSAYFSRISIIVQSVRGDKCWN